MSCINLPNQALLHIEPTPVSHNVANSALRACKQITCPILHLIFGSSLNAAQPQNSHRSPLHLQFCSITAFTSAQNLSAILARLFPYRPLTKMIAIGGQFRCQRTGLSEERWRTRVKKKEENLLCVTACS
jgi:hypothetical protein